MNSKDKLENPNRDPITCEPRSHPVGTGAGAAAGGVAGAGMGAAGGPVGSAVGAAAGAVVGGVGGKAAGEKINPTHASDLGRYIDYTVIDRTGDKVGTVDAVWADHTGQPFYLAVRTGWLHVGKAHVVPAHEADVNESQRTIRLPFEAERIKKAPSFDCQDDITEESDRSIRDYFGLKTETETPRATAKDTERIHLKQEEVKVGKREVEYGGVRLRKIVRTENVSQPVELKREEIVVERTPATGESTRDRNSDFKDEEIYIPLRREEPVVEKSVRPTEEVRVGKRAESDRRDVSETVRKEDVEIEREEREGAAATRR